MRGSYQWALARLLVLAIFVVPALLLQPQRSQAHDQSWLAAVDMTESLLGLHEAMLGSDAPDAATITRVNSESSWQGFEAAAQRELKAAQLHLKQETARCELQQRQLQLQLQPLNNLPLLRAESSRSPRPVRS